MGVKDRLIEYLKFKGIGQNKFAESIGVSSGYVNNIRKSIQPDKILSIANIYTDLNTEWLLTGNGDMLKTLSSCLPLEMESVKKEGQNYRLVPLRHIDSVGGIHSSNEIAVNENQYIDGYVPFVNAQEDDVAIFQTGISMIPTIPPGSIMQIRKVERWREFFGYGNIFVLELADGRRITKEVNRYAPNPKEYVWCHSHNPEVADEELPKDMIVSVWKVIKILTDKGW